MNKAFTKEQFLEAQRKMLKIVQNQLAVWQAEEKQIKLAIKDAEESPDNAIVVLADEPDYEDQYLNYIIIPKKS